jgi:hypothetical protein
MFTPDLIAGGTLRPKDILKLFDSTNKSIVGIRQQMCKLETDRLKDNFNKIPRDLNYLVKSEVELKRELCLLIE